MNTAASVAATSASAAYHLQQELERVEAELAAHWRDTAVKAHTAEEQRARMKRLDALTETHTRLRAEAKAAELRESGANTLQIVGLEALQQYARMQTPCVVFIPKTSDFVQAFERFRSMQPRQPQPPPPVPANFSVTTERNFAPNADGSLKPAEQEYFIHFANYEDACYALGLQQPLHVNIQAGTNAPGFNVQFSKPTRGDAERKAWRAVSEIIERLAGIDSDLAAIGAARDGNGVPRIAPKYIDLDEYDHDMRGWKQARADGATIDAETYSILRHRTPLAAAPVLRRIKQLFDEECDLLIRLRELQRADARLAALKF